MRCCYAALNTASSASIAAATTRLHRWEGTQRAECEQAQKAEAGTSPHAPSGVHEQEFRVRLEPRAPGEEPATYRVKVQKRR